MVLYSRAFLFFVFMFCGVMAFGALSNPVQAEVQQIIAVVNDEAISARDFYKRMRLVMVSSGLPDNEEIRNKIMPQIIGILINEKIMVQEARKMDIKLEQDDIERGFVGLAAQNKVSSDQFIEMLKKNGVDISTIYAQIEAQVAWSSVVQKKLRPKVIISDRDVDDVLGRTKDKVGTKEYLAAEIFLPTDDVDEEKQVKQLANKLVHEIKSGKASFFKLSQQFSKSVGASNGGDMGWLQETQIAEEILNGFQSIKVNQVSSPIKTPDGYHILFLRDTRTLTEDTIPSRDQIYYNLGAERLEKLQRRYLMDVKASSFIDIRV